MEETITCSKCGEVSPYSANYCSNCGKGFKTLKRNLENPPGKLRIWTLDPDFDHRAFLAELFDSRYEVGGLERFEGVTRADVTKVLESLPMEERQLLIHKFGLSNQGKETYQQIAAALGLLSSTGGQRRVHKAKGLFTYRLMNLFPRR